MYRLIADYHTHTVMSHGRSTAEENVKKAVELGLPVLGVADHSVGHPAFGIEDADAYVAELSRLKEAYRDKLHLSIGIELNFISLNGQVDLPESQKDAFDHLILGYHQFVKTYDGPTFYSFFIERYLFKNSAKLKNKATDMYIEALSGGGITILAHPGYAIPIDYRAVAGACAQFGTLFEINNKHDDLLAKDIETAAKTGVKFVLSSDAHRLEAVGHVEKALQKALAAGLGPKEIVNIEEVSP